jgi:hypothetical protein
MAAHRFCGVTTLGLIMNASRDQPKRAEKMKQPGDRQDLSRSLEGSAFEVAVTGK